MVLQGHFCFGMGRSLSLLANNCQDQLCPPLLEGRTSNQLFVQVMLPPKVITTKKRTSHLPTIYIYTYRVLTYIIYISIYIYIYLYWLSHVLVGQIPKKTPLVLQIHPPCIPNHLRIPILSPSSQVEMKKSRTAQAGKTHHNQDVYIYNYI